MPTGTKSKPSALTIAIAARLRSEMAAKTPVVYQRHLEDLTGIPQSTISRFLKPEKTMSIEQLDALCVALGLDAGQVMTEAREAVRSQEAARTAEPAAETVDAPLRKTSVPARPEHAPSQSRAPRSTRTSRKHK